MDIAGNIKKFVDGGSSKGIKPLERYASFDYCFNYFQAFREEERTKQLANAKHIQESCLQLGFYLASWGMLRGSTFLLTKSVKALEPLVTEISNADSKLWEIDANTYTPQNIELILDFGRTIQKALEYSASQTLVTKIMLGVFGNIPAFDAYFCRGFHTWTFGKRAIAKIGDFYQANSNIIERNRRQTLDFLSGRPTKRIYTRAKVIDMNFFIEGGK